MKTYRVNLDDSPRKRWVEIIGDHQDAINKAHYWITQEYSLNSILGNILKQSAFLAKPYVLYNSDIEAISELSNIDYGTILLLQLTYEMSACCTSVIAKNHHIRTMDWGLKFLTDLTIQIEFVRGDTSLFKCITWAGYIGVLTGVTTNFTIAINYRRSKSGTLIDNIQNLMVGSWPIGFLVRNMLENQHTYKEVVKIIKNADLVSPTYFSVTGPKGDGVVIARSPKMVVKTHTLKNFNYIVQTNIDGLDSNFDILKSKKRLKMANSYLSEVKEITKESLWHLMNKKPINNDITIYTSYMKCGEDYYLEVNVK